MFIYGRTGTARCSDDGKCICLCETEAEDGSCPEIDNSGFNLYKYAALQAMKKECSGAETSRASLSSIEECAKHCNGKSEMFIYGRTETARCSDDGKCICICETEARNGSCSEIDNSGFNLYKYT